MFWFFCNELFCQSYEYCILNIKKKIPKGKKRNGNVDNVRIRILRGLNLRDAFHLVHQIFIIRFVRPVSVSRKVNEPFFDQQGAPPKLARFRPALLF